MTTNTDYLIANTLEKLQHINPELYAYWYSKLYPPHGELAYWNKYNLQTLQSLIN